MRSILLLCGLVSLVVACAATPPGDAIGPLQEREDVDPNLASYYAVLGSGDLSVLAQPPPRAEGSSASGNVLYPGDAGAGGFLASILIHAAIQSGVTSAREKAFLEHSQQLLDPHKEVLDGIDISDIKTNAMEALEAKDANFVAGTYVEGGYILALDPVFVLSHTGDSWGLAASVRIFSSLNDALEEVDVKHSRDVYVQTFSDADGNFSLEKLEHRFQELFEAAVVVSRDDYLGRLEPTSAQEQTVRFLSNGRKQVERGYILDVQDKHVLFRSLRGELKLVPRFTEI